MKDYCIQVQNGRTAVSRIVAGKPEPILFRGETWLESNRFWPLFREKIEYSEDELIALLVLSDDDSFVVDPAFTIAERFDCTTDEIVRVVNTLSSPSGSVRTYPDIDLRSSAVIKRQQNPDASTGNDPDEVNPDSLQGFFLRKTQEYRRG